MASMNISLSDPMRDYVQDRISSGQYASASDYVRDLIRRDQAEIADADRWARELDTSIAQSIAEMEAGGGIDLDDACEMLLREWNKADGATRP